MKWYIALYSLIPGFFSPQLSKVFLWALFKVRVDVEVADHLLLDLLVDWNDPVEHDIESPRGVSFFENSLVLFELPQLGDVKELFDRVQRELLKDRQWLEELLPHLVALLLKSQEDLIVLRPRQREEMSVRVAVHVFWYRAVFDQAVLSKGITWLEFHELVLVHEVLEDVYSQLSWTNPPSYACVIWPWLSSGRSGWSCAPAKDCMSVSQAYLRYTVAFPIIRM